MSMSTNTRRIISAGIAGAAIAASALIAPATAHAAPFKACGETWTSVYTAPTGTPLFTLTVYFRSAGSGAIRFCPVMRGKDAPGRVMKIALTKPVSRSVSTNKSVLYTKQTVKAGSALRGKAIFTYDNPAKPGGKGKGSVSFNFPVT